MSGPSNVKELPLTDKRQLVEFHASGGRPIEQWTIGTEHEKFGFRIDDLRPPTYEGERGIEAMLRGLPRFGWEPFEEHGKVIALLRDGASITLEPAGQFELSGAMLENIHQTCCETMAHLQEVKTVADEIGLGFLGMGFQPKWRRDEMPWMPKGRYQIMRDYMPKKGSLASAKRSTRCAAPRCGSPPAWRPSSDSLPCSARPRASEWSSRSRRSPGISPTKSTPPFTT